MVKKLTIDSTIEDLFSKVNELVDAVNGVENNDIYVVVYWDDNTEPVTQLFRSKNRAEKLYDDVIKDYYAYLETWDLSEIH